MQIKPSVVVLADCRQHQFVGFSHSNEIKTWAWFFERWLSLTQD